MLVGCLVAALVAFTVNENKYLALTTIVAVEQTQGASQLGALGAQLGGLASLAGFSIPSSDGFRVEAFATLESRELLRQFILEENLTPILFADHWDDQKKVWNTDSGESPSAEDAVRFLQEEVVTINRESGSSIVEVSVKWHDPELCQKWANELVRRANARIRQRAIVEATKSIEFLEKELSESSNTGVKSAAFGLIEQQMATIMLANVRTDYAFRVIDPATQPDIDDPVSPRLIVLLLAGVLVWVLLGGIMVSAVALRDRAD